ncbi:MAG TPA: UDP-N-acetylmuramoyl-tripeptide--D-alanyl-D-alanine ligase [Caulobacteraceae bacterium]|nr:UDP-N-acetylmuramoyl-tripeptide--D-alanyl-D-alanine ligase [Caulobacteraceae bacterium]
MSEPLWTSGEIALAVGGAVEGSAFAATGVSIDTRTIEPGDLFVALAGARDGHDFIDGALASGAAGSLASRSGAGPRVLVRDVQAGLEAMALHARDRSGARRGAVTGSVGKTSVTQAVRAGLALAGRAHGSVKSYNNQIGVPLTLARMPRATERAVFEIGMNHAGEIEPLSRMVAPHVVCVTTVGPVHTENFADGERGVALAKAEIFAGLQPGGIAVLNADNAWYGLLREAALKAGAVVRSFGSTEACDARLLDFSAHDTGAVVRARLNGRALDIPLLQRGAHWGPNSLAVLLILEAMGVSLDDGLAALATFEPLEGRGSEQTVRAPAGAFVLIDESYNANPISMRAALATLGGRAAMGRRIAVLTDMLELGPQAALYHAEIADVLERNGIDLVFCAGPLMKNLWDGLPPTRRGGYAETAAQLAPRVVQAVGPGDVVMVKGSNGSKASIVAQALAALAAGADSSASVRVGSGG